MSDEKRPLFYVSGATGTGTAQILVLYDFNTLNGSDISPFANLNGQDN